MKIHTNTDRKTDGPTTYRQRDIYIERHIHIQTNTKTHRYTHTLSDMDTETYKHSDIHMHTKRHAQR